VNAAPSKTVHLFVLRQNLELYDAYQRQIEACDRELESLLRQMASGQDEPQTPLPRGTLHAHQQR